MCPSISALNAVQVGCLDEGRLRSIVTEGATAALRDSGKRRIRANINERYDTNLEQYNVTHNIREFTKRRTI